jgi:hypothetical protein
MTDNTNLLNPVTPIYNGAALSGANALPVNVTPGLPATGITAIAGNAAGTTGAVVGTLTATSTTTAYISGFTVSAIGGVAAVGPITVAGLAGGSQIYQMNSTATGNTLSVNFAGSIPASAVNTNITVTTTADGTATAVNVNSWGFLK